MHAALDIVSHHMRREKLREISSMQRISIWVRVRVYTTIVRESAHTLSLHFSPVCDSMADEKKQWKRRERRNKP
jgi:hypothetical protein